MNYNQVQDSKKEGSVVAHPPAVKAVESDHLSIEDMYKTARVFKKRALPVFKKLAKE